MAESVGTCRHFPHLCYMVAVMGKIEEIARFRAWFEAFDADCFDEKIERDAKAGKLDKLAEQALTDFRAGHARQI